MKTLDGRPVTTYPSNDDYPHKPTDEPNWQESFVLHFWNEESRLGGYFRLGHEANAGIRGEMNVFCDVLSPDGFFRRRDVFPKNEGDYWEKGLTANDGSIRYEFDGRHIKWTIREPNVTADLVVTDLYAPIDGYPKSGQISDFAPKHVDISVRVSGTITTQGSTYEVHALGVRDHGWGSRAWGTLISHRWVIGTIDEENSFCAICTHTADDAIVRMGWITRGETLIYANVIDIVAFTDVDGVTSRGGFLRMILTTGEVYEVLLETTVPCVTSVIHGYLVTDTFCTAKWGDKVGVGDFEMASNISRGTHLPETFVPGTIHTNGWHPRADLRRGSIGIHRAS